MPCDGRTGRLTPEAACNYPIGHRFYRTSPRYLDSFEPRFDGLLVTPAEIEEVYNIWQAKVEEAKIIAEEKASAAYERLQRVIEEMRRLHDSITSQMQTP